MRPMDCSPRSCGIGSGRSQQHRMEGIDIDKNNDLCREVES